MTLDFDWRGSIRWMKREATILGVRHGMDLRHHNMANAGHGVPLDSIPEWLAQTHEAEHAHLLQQAVQFDTQEFFYRGYSRGEEIGKAGLPNPYGISEARAVEAAPIIGTFRTL